MTAHERTGFRDAELSARHRIWGFHVPAVDVDFLLVEYDSGAAAAIIDYKHKQSAIGLNQQRPSLNALSNLHKPDGQQLPFLVVYYDPSRWAFKVFPINEQATYRCGGNGPYTCSERQWVQVLHKIRGREVKDHQLEQFNTADWSEQDQWDYRGFA
jgi:hypothetical protein